MTVIIGLPLVIFVVFLGGLPLVVACTAIALVGLRELYIAICKEHKAIHGVGYLFTVGYFAIVYLFGFGYLLLITLTIFIIAAQTFMVAFFKKLTLVECISTVYGFLYIPFLLAFIVLVREHEQGLLFVWLIFTAAFACDTFAYIVGCSIGRHKLKNSPSPSKSVEGLIGGALGAALVGGLFGFFISRFTDMAGVEFILQAIVISVIGALFCSVGDMAASAIKRNTGIKDFGNIFPGHGGVIDRIDGILFVAPVVFIVMNWLV